MDRSGGRGFGRAHFFGVELSVCSLCLCFLQPLLINYRGINWPDIFLIGSATPDSGPIGWEGFGRAHFFGVEWSVCSLCLCFLQPLLINYHGINWPDIFLIGSATPDSGPIGWEGFGRAHFFGVESSVCSLCSCFLQPLLIKSHGINGPDN